MKLIDLLESTPSAGKGVWPKTFRNLKAHNSWCSFLRYKSDCSWESSEDGENWRPTKGYWMFLPGCDWEAVKQEHTWSLEKVIPVLWGERAVLAFSYDVTGNTKYIVPFIRINGNGMVGVVDLNIAFFTLEAILNSVIEEIRKKYTNHIGRTLFKLPTDLQQIRESLGI